MESAWKVGEHLEDLHSGHMVQCLVEERPEVLAELEGEKIPASVSEEGKKVLGGKLHRWDRVEWDGMVWGGVS